jgi:transposase-like protein
MPARRRGRPHEGPELVDKLDDCSEQARQRLKVIFQTLAGVFTVEQACRALGIRRSAFYKLRARFIEHAVQLLEPRTPGRRKRTVTPEKAENQRLLQENERLRFELEAQQLREEIGLLMPGLLKPRRTRQNNLKKKSSPQRQRRTRNDYRNSPS